MKLLDRGHKVKDLCLTHLPSVEVVAEAVSRGQRPRNALHQEIEME